jgi:hypothetical protein
MENRIQNTILMSSPPTDGVKRTIPAHLFEPAKA